MSKVKSLTSASGPTLRDGKDGPGNPGEHGVLATFRCWGKIPDIHNLQKKDLLWLLLSGVSVHSQLAPEQTQHDGGELLTSWWPESRELGKESKKRYTFPGHTPRDLPPPTSPGLLTAHSCRTHWRLMHHLSKSLLWTRGSLGGTFFFNLKHNK